MQSMGGKRHDAATISRSECWTLQPASARSSMRYPIHGGATRALRHISRAQLRRSLRRREPKRLPSQTEHLLEGVAGNALLVATHREVVFASRGATGGDRGRVRPTAEHLREVHRDREGQRHPYERYRILTSIFHFAFCILHLALIEEQRVLPR
jgi:hypothetical protein